MASISKSHIVSCEAVASSSSDIGAVTGIEYKRQLGKEEKIMEIEVVNIRVSGRFSPNNSTLKQVYSAIYLLLPLFFTLMLYYLVILELFSEGVRIWRG